MGIWNDPRLRKLFREKREQLGLKQQDLSDDTVSAATISNYETGKKKVGEDKIVYIFKKVGVSEEDLPNLLQTQEKDESEQNQFLEIQLKSIETTIDCGDVMASLKRLRELNIDPNHYLACRVEYLRGKCYSKREKWEKANSYYERAIYLYDKNEEKPDNYCKALSLYQLAYIYSRKNNLQQALIAINEGIRCLESMKEPSVPLFQLLLSKASYLEKLDRNEEALQVLDQIQEENKIIHSDMILAKLEILTTIFKKIGMYENSIHFAYQGIELARQLKNDNRLFYLWTLLGSVYYLQNNHDLAKICLQTSMELEDGISKQVLDTPHRIQLGQLYLRFNNYNQAESYLKNAIQASIQSTNIDPKVSEAIIALAECYHLQNNENEYLHHLEKSYHLAQKHQLLPLQKSILLRITRYYESRDYEQYKSYLNEYYKVSIQLDSII